MLVPINAEHPEPRKIQRAVQVLDEGGLLAYPTDTVYGLGCDLLAKQAIDRLYQVKGMPRSKHLSFICHDLSNIAKYAIVDNTTYRTLKHYLPGPYCFILRATREVPKMVQTKQKTVGIRVPDHAVTQALVRELGRPIVTTTAARSDEDPIFDPWQIDDEFPGLDMVLAAEGCGIVPTTVVDLSEGEVKVLRQGAGLIDDLLD